MDLPEQLDDAEAVLRSGDRTRIGELLARVFPTGAVLVFSNENQIAVAGHAVGRGQGVGLLVTAAQLLGQQDGCSVMFMQGLNIAEEQQKNGLAIANELPKGLPNLTELRRLRNGGRHPHG